MKATPVQLSKLLLAWYKENHRDLPWRRDRDPYRIWISEVMLQQTTVAAVIPYYEKFLARFPTVQNLAQAKLESVYEQWAGLGYYSRARNLHKAAQVLAANGFPKSAEELLQLPGFGPYTSRAVSSLAFGEQVGVLDGNVIRVLCRAYGWNTKWWNGKARAPLQTAADDIASQGPSELLNQGLMELGATVCTPQNPICLICPWSQHCVALKSHQTDQIPKKRPRKKTEVWVWKLQLMTKGSGKAQKLALIPNDYAPFLKGRLIFPGSICQQAEKPKSFDLQHGITHHSIYIQIEKISPQNLEKIQWVASQEIKKINPSNLMQKVLQTANQKSESLPS